ncbi:MAG: InlB B-repeat-containing protein, partial [Candidatus Gallimonas sp.]
MAKRGRMFAVFFSLLVCVASLVAAVACGGKGGDVKYTVTYAAGADDATGSVPVESYVAGAPVILRDVDTFVRDGYEFTQWSDGSELYDAGDTYVMPAKNVTFTAQWKKTETQSLPDGSEQVDSIPVGALVTENGTAKANWFAQYGENGIEITAWVADAAVYTVSDNVYASDGIEIVFAVL